MKQDKDNPIIVFTDLDGSLLDHYTYSYQEASQALKRLQEEKIPLILNSSKTRAEVVRLWKQLDLDGPFIFENGGGIAFPKGYPYGYPVGVNPKTKVWPLGRSYQDLTALFHWLKEDHCLPMTGFSDMSAGELARITGLDPAAAKEAKKREFSEPFLFEGSMTVFQVYLREIRKRGLQVTQGGRFYHLSGKHDKGTAIKKMMRWFQTGHRVKPITIGIGDSPNDFPMLKVCDWPVLIRRVDGTHAPFSGPKVYRTRAIGPKGWREGINHLLDILKKGGKS
jgi:mannosyl-3-phosphoglycerate phosphatase